MQSAPRLFNLPRTFSLAVLMLALPLSAAADVLPSWNDTTTRQAIVDFFTTWRVTEEPSREPAKTGTHPSRAATSESEPR